MIGVKFDKEEVFILIVKKTLKILTLFTTTAIQTLTSCLTGETKLLHNNKEKDEEFYSWVEKYLTG